MLLRRWSPFLIPHQSTCLSPPFRFVTTVLLDVDMTALGRLLNPNKLKLQAKGVKSAQARVCNLGMLLVYGVRYECVLIGVVLGALPTSDQSLVLFFVFLFVFSFDSAIAYPLPPTFLFVARHQPRLWMASTIAWSPRRSSGRSWRPPGHPRTPPSSTSPSLIWRPSPRSRFDFCFVLPVCWDVVFHACGLPGGRDGEWAARVASCIPHRFLLLCWTYRTHARTYAHTNRILPLLL